MVNVIMDTEDRCPEGSDMQKNICERLALLSSECEFFQIDKIDLLTRHLNGSAESEAIGVLEEREYTD
jgi:hypothetical protein